MTTDPFRNALAEALSHDWQLGGFRLVRRDAERLADAMLQHPSLARLAALAEVGEAVGRLPTDQGWIIDLAPDGAADTESGRRYEVQLFGSRRAVYGPTIPAAVAAALGDES